MSTMSTTKLRVDRIWRREGRGNQIWYTSQLSFLAITTSMLPSSLQASARPTRLQPAPPTLVTRPFSRMLLVCSSLVTLSIFSSTYSRIAPRGSSDAMELGSSRACKPRAAAVRLRSGEQPGKATCSQTAMWCYAT